MPILANNENLVETYAIELDYLALQAIGTAGTKIIGSIPIGGAVTLCGVTNNLDIAGSSSLVVDVGTTLADPDEFINALDVDAMTVGLTTWNTGDLMLQSAGTTVTLGGITPVKSVSAVTPIYIKVTDAAIASITAGKIVIVLQVLNPLKFAG
jgi:hypothetical protein